MSLAGSDGAFIFGLGCLIAFTWIFRYGIGGILGDSGEGGALSVLQLDGGFAVGKGYSAVGCFTCQRSSILGQGDVEGKDGIRICLPAV